MTKKGKIKKLQYELGRYEKKVGEQAKIIRRMQRDLDDAGQGAVQMMQYADCVCIQTALSYGEREIEDGQVIGYRLELPRFSIQELRKRYEIRCRHDEEKDVMVIAVMPHT